MNGKTGKRMLAGCLCGPLLLGWVAVAAVFVVFVAGGDRVFDTLDELISGKPTPRPVMTLDLTQQAIEVAILPDTQVDYSWPCPDSDFSAAIEAWGDTVNAASAGQMTQEQVEQRLVEIIEGAGGIAECLARIQVKSIGYTTYDTFAHNTYGMPPEVSIVDLYELNWLAKNAQSQGQPTSELRKVYDGTMQSKSRQAALWLVRRMPVYYPGQGWVTFDQYAKNMIGELGSIDPNSRFEQDPVGTAFDLMTGNYTEDDLVEWFALETVVE